MRRNSLHITKFRDLLSRCKQALEWIMRLLNSSGSLPFPGVSITRLCEDICCTADWTHIQGAEGTKRRRTMSQIRLEIQSQSGLPKQDALQEGDSIELAEVIHQDQQFGLGLCL